MPEPLPNVSVSEDENPETGDMQPTVNGEFRSYGCSFGCGNPYDYVMVTVADGTTEFLCLPCFLKLATEIMEAVINPANPDAPKWLASMSEIQQAPMTSSKPRKRGKNAPVSADDPDIIVAFDSVITVDELPEAFR